MTNLIYRGVHHDGQQTPADRKPQTLIYRSIAHDGLSSEANPVRSQRNAMCYRGLRYTLGADHIAAPAEHAPAPRRLAEVFA